MSDKSHHDRNQPLTQNQNNEMSEDPGDGSRNSDRLGAVDEGKPLPKAPEGKKQHDKEMLEAFGEEGAGIAAKE